MIDIVQSRIFDLICFGIGYVAADKFDLCLALPITLFLTSQVCMFQKHIKIYKSMSNACKSAVNSVMTDFKTQTEEVYFKKYKEEELKKNIIGLPREIVEVTLSYVPRDMSEIERNKFRQVLESDIRSNGDIYNKIVYTAHHK
jgi:hypothetical protein